RNYARHAVFPIGLFIVLHAVCCVKEGDMVSNYARGYQGYESDFSDEEGEPDTNAKKRRTHSHLKTDGKPLQISLRDMSTHQFSSTFQTRAGKLKRIEKKKKKH
ncbi:hypothetical protein AB205_0218600, partial [Aquarana catesbeiana]